MSARNNFIIKPNYSYALAEVMTGGVSMMTKIPIRISEPSLTKEQLAKLNYYGFNTEQYSESTPILTATITADMIDGMSELTFLTTIDLDGLVIINGSL